MKKQMLAGILAMMVCVMTACGAAEDNSGLESEQMTETVEAAEAEMIPETEIVAESEMETETELPFSERSWLDDYTPESQNLMQDLDGDGCDETICVEAEPVPEAGGEYTFTLVVKGDDQEVITSHEILRTNPLWYPDFNIFAFTQEHEGQVYVCYQYSIDLNPYCIVYAIMHMEDEGLVMDNLMYDRSYEEGPTLYDCTDLVDLQYYFDKGEVIYSYQYEGTDDPDVWYANYEEELDRHLSRYGLDKEKMFTHLGEETHHSFRMLAKKMDIIYSVYPSQEVIEAYAQMAAAEAAEATELPETETVETEAAQ